MQTLVPCEALCVPTNRNESGLTYVPAPPVLSDLVFAPRVLVLPSGLYMFRVCAAGDCFVTSYLRVLSVSGRVGNLLFIFTVDQANLR